MPDSMTQFEILYAKIAKSENFVKPNFPRLDSWAVDRYETGPWFAGMSDAGYSRFVGKHRKNGKTWRVDESYGRPLAMTGITAKEFNKLDSGKIK